MKETTNEVVRDIHNYVTTSSGATTKTVNELVKDIRDAVANGVMSESDVRAIISEIVGQAPEALDTLEEVAEALSGIYTKSQVDSILSDYYTKTQIDTTINSRVNKDVIAPTYDDSSAYAVGDYVFYGDVLYRCNTAIGSSGESWNATHWTAVIVTNGIDGQGGLTPEQLALIENAQWKSEGTTELFNETLEGWQGAGATLSYSDEITADPLYVTFNGEEYTCPRNEYFGMVCYGGFGSSGPDFSEYPFFILRSSGVNSVTPSYNSSQTFTISARGTTTTYTDAFKNGVEKYSCTYVKDYINPQTNQKTGGVVEGDVLGNVASGASYPHAEGSGTTASGTDSHAEGSGTTASGAYSHAEGSDTTASAYYSHAEGQDTTASGTDSHAEGHNTTASGDDSHAEGYNTIASGGTSHAEGEGTIASGRSSHTEGDGTIANHRSQHVFGQFNVNDASTANMLSRGNYVEIVGNGTADNNRSNARTLDWSGNEVLSGNLTLGKGTVNETELTAKKLKELVACGGGDADNLANKYDNTTTYNVGDYCIYNNVLYKCNTSISSNEDWTSAHWTEVKVTDEIVSASGSDSSELFIIDLTFEPKHGYDYKTDSNYKGVWSGNTVYNEGDIVWIRRGTSNISDAEPWSADSTYEEDALVSYRGKYYKCINYVEGEGTEETPRPDTDTTHWENTSETSVDYGDYYRFLGEEQYMFSIPPVYYTEDEPPVNYIEQSSWYRGSWSNSTTYSIGNIVTFEEDIVENEGTEDEVTCHYTYTAISKVDNNLNNVIPNSVYEDSEYWRTIIVSQIRTDGTSGSESSGSTWELCSSYNVQDRYIGNKTYNEVFTAISDGKTVVAREHINDGKAEDDFDDEVYRYFYCDEAYSSYEPMVESDYERLDMISFGKISNNGIGILRSDDPIILYPESSEERITDPLVVNFNYNEGDIEDVTEKDEYAGAWDENTSYDTDQIVSIKTYESPSHYEYIENWKGEWNLTVTYNENDLVRVTSDPTLLPDYKGTWDSATTYNQGDIVSVEIDNETKFYHSYSSDNIGNDPSTDEYTEYWSLYYPEYSDYIGRSSDNISNNPTTDDETNWISIFNVDYDIESDYAINYKGAWDSSVAYNDGDTVSYVNNDSVTQYYQYYWADTDPRTSPDENPNWIIIGPNASTSYHKSLIDSNENNNPATDDGTNWEIYEPQLGDPYYESDCSYEDITEALNAGRYVYGRDSYLPGDAFDSHECHIYTLTECSTTGYGGESVSKHMVFSTTSEFGKTTVLKSLGHYVGWDEKLKFEVVEAGSGGSSDVIVIPITFVSEEYVEENQNYYGEWSSSETYSTGAIVSIEDEDANTLYYYLPSEDYADSEDIPGKSYKWEEYTPKPAHYHMNYHPEQIIRDAANGISMIAVTDNEDREFIEGYGYTFILSEVTSLIPGIEGDDTVYGRITFTRFSSDENAIESICFDDVISWNSENIEEFNGIDLSISKLSVASTHDTISVNDIATEFDMYEDYVTGDLVFYKPEYYGEYHLFRCISPVTNGSEWNEEDWEDICINDMYVPKDSIAPRFDSTVAYNQGDIVWYNNRLYKANTSIASGDSFNDSNWNRTTIMEELLSS